MGNHHDVQIEQLSAYLDGQLSDVERATLEKHLDECSRCRRELDELEATVALLHALPVPRPPRSFTLDPATVAPRRRLLPSLRWAAAALTVLLVLTVGLDLANQPQMAAPRAAVSDQPSAAGAPATGGGMSEESTPYTHQESAFEPSSENNQIQEAPAAEASPALPTAVAGMDQQRAREMGTKATTTPLSLEPLSSAAPTLAADPGLTALDPGNPAAANPASDTADLQQEPVPGEKRGALTEGDTIPQTETDTRSWLRRFEIVVAVLLMLSLVALVYFSRHPR